MNEFVADSDAVQRLAWHLFTEGDDMDDPATAELAERTWANPRHAKQRAAYVERARRYLAVALDLSSMRTGR